jgi:hypothetical protein
MTPSPAFDQSTLFALHSHVLCQPGPPASSQSGPHSVVGRVEVRHHSPPVLASQPPTVVRRHHALLAIVRSRRAAERWRHALPRGGIASKDQRDPVQPNYPCCRYSALQRHSCTTRSHRGHSHGCGRSVKRLLSFNRMMHEIRRVIRMDEIKAKHLLKAPYSQDSQVIRQRTKQDSLRFLPPDDKFR